MLAGQSGPFPAQNEPPRSDRVTADNWRGLYGSDPFSSIWPLTAICRIQHPSKRRNLPEYINACGVFPVRGWRLAIQVGYCRLGQLLDCRTRGFRVRLRAL